MSSQELWSRRSFMKGAVGPVGILLLNSQFTEELKAIQQTVFGKERNTDLTALSLGEAGDLVRRKVVSPVELTRACLQRIEQLNPALNAFVTVTPKRRWRKREPLKLKSGAAGGAGRSTASLSDSKTTSIQQE
jgi:hypothetical protein